MRVEGRSRWLLPVFVILLGVVLRLYQVGHQSLWLDEYFSFFLSGKDLSSIVEGTSQDVLPPLYYFTLHLALEFGSTESILRLPSVLFSILTLPMLFELGRLLFGHRVALLSTFLLAINPLHVLFAQEARMYTMFTFFSALSLLFFWKAWRWNRRWHWLLFVLSTTAAFYTHSLAIFNLLAIDLFCLLRLPELKKRWRPLAGSHLLTMLLFLPWLVVMVNQIPRLQSEFVGASQSILTIVTTPHIFLFGVSLKPELAPLALFAGLALVAFTFLSLWYAFRQRRSVTPSLLLALCAFLVPVIGAYLISIISPVFVIRRLLPASLGLLLLISWTVMEAKPRWLNIAAGISVAALMLASLMNYYVDPEVQKVPFREIAHEVEGLSGEGDVIIHATDTSALAFAYYAPHLNSHFLEGDPDYLAETNRGRAQRIAGLVPEDEPTILAGSDRFWLIVVLDHNLEYQEGIVESFNSRYTRLKHQTVHGVDVFEYGVDFLR